MQQDFQNKALAYKINNQAWETNADVQSILNILTVNVNKYSPVNSWCNLHN